MANLYELRYNPNNFKSFDSDDLILIFNGYIFVLNEERNDEEELLRILDMLFKRFPQTKKKFYDEEGNLRKEYRDDKGNIISGIFDTFEDVPYVIIGGVDIDFDTNSQTLTIQNDSYDIVNSPEFKQFINSSASKAFNTIKINGRIINNNDVNNKPHTIQLANPLYHGTTESQLFGIFTKGLRKLQEYSQYRVNNEGFVFLSSVYGIAKTYASDYSKKRQSPMAVLRINSEHIDENKVVLDYDFVKQFTEPSVDDPYVNSRTYNNAHMGTVATNKGRYGSKFAKIGYKGIIMPNAIEGVYLYTPDGMSNQYYTREQYLQMYKQNNTNEAKVHLNEWKPDFYNKLPQKIRLYHGTDIYALEDILIDEEINARAGRRTGETYGVNWFFTSYRDNFSRGVMFSIEADKSEFDDGTFQFMNNAEVTARDSIVSIQGRNFRIESIDGYNQETFNKILKETNGDVYEFLERLYKICKLLNEVGSPYISEPINIQILKQTVGEDYLRQEGIIENVNHVNEVNSSDISLNSFQVKKELNPKIWVNNKMNSRVRLRLLDIADDFIDELAVRWVKPKDIVVTGSIANYNWSAYSDIDVHIIIDYDKVYKKKELVEDYFNSKKEIWKSDHDELKIYGFPVELYVEDSAAESHSSGIYSLNKNEWIKEPSDLDDAKINEKYVKNEAAKYMTEIDGYKKDLSKEKDAYKIEKIGNKVKKLFDKLKGIRKESLKRSGEMGSGNIIYKILRRSGYLDTIWEIINDTYNKSKTLK